MHKQTLKTIIIVTVIVAAAGSFLSFANVSHAALLDVPYTSQVPLGEWNDPRQKDGCEEASILMALMWAQGLQMSPAEVRQYIIGMSDFQQYFFGYFQDSSAQDTASLMAQYFGYPKVRAQHNISAENIKTAIDFGYLVIVPINPRILSTVLYNPSTTRHMVVVVGYDNATGEIIFHDPLIGSYRRAPQFVFQQSLADYSSGRHIVAANRPSAMILVGR